MDETAIQLRRLGLAIDPPFVSRDEGRADDFYQHAPEAQWREDDQALSYEGDDA